jgi:hypothetical protein
LGDELNMKLTEKQIQNLFNPELSASQLGAFASSTLSDEFACDAHIIARSIATEHRAIKRLTASEAAQYKNNGGHRL